MGQEIDILSARSPRLRNTVCGSRAQSEITLTPPPPLSVAQVRAWTRRLRKLNSDADQLRRALASRGKNIA